MEENTPRRMRRFKRKKVEKVVEKLKGIQKKKQKNFTKKLKIEKENPEKIAETLFEQLKKTKERKKTKEKSRKRKKGKTPETPFNKKEAEKTSEEIPLWKKRRMERIKEEEKQPFGKRGKDLNQKEEKQIFGNQKKEKRKHGRKSFEKNSGKSKETEIELPELKGTKITGLFGETKKGKQEAIGELNELKLDLNERIEELDEKGEEKILDLGKEETKTKESPEKGICINCKQKFNVLIFCSKCGNAFCDKCAKIKQKEETKTKYTCPHCGHATKK